ncbi:TIM44-like domain-containing protein [Pseudoroseomonas cervicalis]|uniref:TIM44-like domain-containing protein n=1 Tax=Teichococcus cervicalis TaxID=204525 RepID=UPI002782301D|nr:TIM44-like domain-containing protein [Pseudoroseomonas cervicalis]MDQ1080097.1 putative lipid-binding transport protein (Tim44 family) [Pseudoroseomonas cervicalis]
MRIKARLLAGFAALALVLGPALAEARPGGGSSSGSRGSRTFSAPPVTRTAPDAPRAFDRTAPQTQAPRPGMATPAPAASRGGLFGGGFGGALMGGLIGVGIGGLLFGNGLFGGISGLGGLLGLLIQIALVVLLVRFALRFFRSRQPAMAGGPREGLGMAREAQPGPRPMMGGGAAATQPIQVTQADYHAFETLLRDINAAWSRRDEAGLTRMATPEMASYFAQDLRDLDARGWRNETSDVRLEQGDLSEAWREGDVEYATVAMRFSLVDVTYDTQGRVVEGDPATRSTATELWTFRRRRGGAWQLSAIQPAG